MLHDEVRVTIVTRVPYAASVWWGFVGQQLQRNQTQSVIDSLIRMRYLPNIGRKCRAADADFLYCGSREPRTCVPSARPPNKTKHNLPGRQLRAKVVYNWNVVEC